MMVLNLCQNEERKTINLQATSSKAELCQHLEQHTDPGPAYLACERSLKLPLLPLLAVLMPHRHFFLNLNIA